MYQPNGKVYKAHFYTPDEAAWIAEVMLDRWYDDCVEGWMSDNHEDMYCSENKVKNFLNSIGYMLLQSNQKTNLASGIIEHRKEMAIGERELPMSLCSFDIENAVYAKSGKPPAEEGAPAESAEVPPKRSKKTFKGSGRYDRVAAICKAEGCTPDDFLFLTVDTDGVFILYGQLYRIDESVEPYQPKAVGDDLLYDMDKVVCVKNKRGGYSFYDQELNPIAADGIRPVYGVRK